MTSLYELLAEGHDSIGCSYQEGGDGKGYEWVREIETLLALLEESRRLGLTFDRGNAYITRAYIDHQDELTAKIKSAISKARGQS